MKQPNPLTLFIDRSLGKQIVATALRIAGYQVEVHDDHFPADAKDQEWLTEVGRKRRIVFTKDKKIKHRTLELAAVVAVNARVFTLAAGGVQGPEMAQIFVKAMPGIVKYAAANTAPYIVRITKAGKLARVYPPD